MVAELRAILAKEETRFEEQVATNDHLKAHITRMEADLNSKGESLAQEQKTSDELRESLSNALQLMEEQKTAKLQAQAEVSDLTEKEMALISQLDVARTTLTEAHKASSDLKAEYESTVTSMRGEIESLRHKAEAELRQAEEEYFRHRRRAEP
ncbi:hypothetical protein GTA08_BOTSDO02086 [Neofusicoccum parvum]|nr:hypothetical protein GTA08_BOTSDO02086 [Neofusicoccum parvum]